MYFLTRCVIDGAAYSVSDVSTKKKKLVSFVQLLERIPQTNELLFVCYVATFFNYFKISSRWGLDSPQRHPITYQGQAS